MGKREKEGRPENVRKRRGKKTGEQKGGKGRREERFGGTERERREGKGIRETEGGISNNLIVLCKGGEAREREKKGREKESGSA